ncbi:chemotaxis response regulator protein-glutamate methylesterase of group 1 operon [Shewanella sp. NFH-SH190041]|uniref:protein-glutamate methylesterase/protein-glutamine glutaminase n=1 Tax=Shewanella sp. NFH-SH190041 TaxID=2950245 RepID=UPI0021C2F9C0|nr:chemotaxis response regulator protein-glutamate methylesterase [Shewanella sp. NFH-SH190041]BDM62860.1 chemotaxis response regulator protein-glutamate methylesterase of group 1 operon [Shewanella sp. NFH-SH190041]
MIKVLVVDDSALVRQLLSHMLSQAPDIKVVGSAEDPYQAREMIKSLNPDVLTLDVEMPKMDGISFLRNLMKLRPMPVIMISTLTEKGAAVTLEALSLGAIDYIAKPKSDLSNKLLAYQDDLIAKIRLAARCNVRPSSIIPPQPAASTTGEKHKLKSRLIAIGASTGGTEAIAQIIAQLPDNFPPIVIAQHIPAAFSASFARRLDGKSAMTVHEAKGNEQLKPGHVYVAPGDKHLTVRRQGAHLYTRLEDTEPVNRHKPSVEVLFNSIAKEAAKTTIGVMLTGMGKDGAEAMLNLRNQGAHTLVQDEATSVVWGMPGAAVDVGASQEQQPLGRIAPRLLQLLKID